MINPILGDLYRPSSSGGGGGGGGGRFTSRTNNYNRFSGRNYRTPSSRRFGATIGRAAGFGGVVLGNDVNGTDRVVRGALVDARGDATTIRVVLDDRSEYVYGPIRYDIALAARDIVFGNQDRSLAPWISGEAIGLASLDVPHQVRTASNVMFPVVLHPGVLDRRIGVDAILVDSLPIAHRRLIEGVRRSFAGEDGVEAAQSVAEFIRDQEAFGGNWKFIDVPLGVSLDSTDRTINVARQDDPGHTFPEGLRRAAYLEMNIFSSTTRDTHSPELAARFYRLLPLLLRSSGEFQGLNELAGTLAVLRWARAHGLASVVTQLVSESPITTPEALRVTDAAVAVVPAAQMTTASRQQEQQRRARIDQLFSRVGLTTNETRSNYGTGTFSGAPAPDPYQVDIESGGDVNSGAGAVTHHPDYILNLTVPVQGLRIFVRTSGDTTLIVRAPDRHWYFSDDEVGLNPLLDFETAPAGRYSIWIGAIGQNQHGQLVFTTHQDLTP